LCMLFCANVCPRELASCHQSVLRIPAEIAHTLLHACNLLHACMSSYTRVSLTRVYSAAVTPPCPRL
jgi:hypothetical protein